jgi:hypothetical protein
LDFVVLPADAEPSTPPTIAETEKAVVMPALAGKLTVVVKTFPRFIAVTPVPFLIGLPLWVE